MPPVYKVWGLVLHFHSGSLICASYCTEMRLLRADIRWHIVSKSGEEDRCCVREIKLTQGDTHVRPPYGPT